MNKKILTITIPCYNSQDYMKKCVDFSVAIGAKSISTQVTANMKIDADAPFETAWKWAVEGLKEAGEYALKNNILDKY